MRLLILSETIDWEDVEKSYRPPYDIKLDKGNLNEQWGFNFSVFDYDVSFIHIKQPSFSEGYYKNLPKLESDSLIALQNGRTIICLPESINFSSYYHDRYRGQITGMSAYQWLEPLGVELCDNEGEDIKPTGNGKVQVLQKYLEFVPRYYQILKQGLNITNKLAVVDDTDIIVGFELQVGKGTLVIIPPPILDHEHYHLVIPQLMEVARRYYERAQRQIIIGDAPEWIGSYQVSRVNVLNGEISKLTDEKLKYDRLSYLLYGTGDELVSSVILLLEELGLKVERQPLSANIDLIAKYQRHNLGFAVEVTGIKGIIRKDSVKVAQVWKHLTDSTGTSKEKDKVVIAANTQYHLEPQKRNPQGFSPDIIKLLEQNSVLMITTFQLYEQWKKVHEGQRSSEEIIKEMYNSSGFYKATCP